MLRVALTGGLGAGKSTAAKMFRALGAFVLSSDEIGRELMQPGQPVYKAIVEHFGDGVMQPHGELDRTALAKIAFTDGRVEELNAIVHPAVIARQAALIDEITTKDSKAVVIVESALIFETKYSETKYAETKHGGEEVWRRRFDKVVLVTAPEELKVSRFVARASKGAVIDEAAHAALQAEAHRRLAQQMTDEKKASLSDYVLTNDGPATELEWQVDQLWPILQAAAGKT
jgi:dephospho-CoA kinase